MAEETKVKVDGTKKFKDYIFAVGRRRSAVARVRLYSKVPSNLKFGEQVIKKGSIVVNEKSVEYYFNTAALKVAYEKPLVLTNTLNKFAITVKVNGGGLHSQLDAFILGLSRILASLSEENKVLLRKNGYLTRDARVRERRKVGMGGKARRKRQSPKR